MVLFMYMKNINLKELAKYSDQYIALSKDKDTVIASNKSLKLLQVELEKKQIEGIIIHYIPPVEVVLSPVCH